MNDFLRPCNCVNPAEEDCEKCVGETAVKTTAEPCGDKDPQKGRPKVVEKPKAAESKTAV